MGRGQHPNSRANLQEPWRRGQSGNPRGRPRGSKHPARRLYELLTRPDLVDAAEHLLYLAAASGEPWAWNLLWHPPPPSIEYPDGSVVEPFDLQLPDTPGWRVFAERLSDIACEDYGAPPVELLRAVGAPLPERYGEPR